MPPSDSQKYNTDSVYEYQKESSMLERNLLLEFVRKADKEGKEDDREDYWKNILGLNKNEKEINPIREVTKLPVLTSSFSSSFINSPSPSPSPTEIPSLHLYDIFNSTSIKITETPTASSSLAILQNKSFISSAILTPSPTIMTQQTRQPSISPYVSTGQPSVAKAFNSVIEERFSKPTLNSQEVNTLRPTSLIIPEEFYVRLSVLFNEPNNITSAGLLAGDFEEVTRSLREITTNSMCSHDFFDVISSVTFENYCPNKVLSRSIFNELLLSQFSGEKERPNATILAVNDEKALYYVMEKKLPFQREQTYYQFDFKYYLIFPGKSYIGDDVIEKVEEDVQDNLLQSLQEETFREFQPAVIAAITVPGLEKDDFEILAPAEIEMQNTPSSDQGFQPIRIIGILLFVATTFFVFVMCYMQNRGFRKISKRKSTNNWLNTEEGVEEILQHSRIARNKDHEANEKEETAQE